MGSAQVGIFYLLYDLGLGYMKRKVIQIAESTQLISLPRKWAQQYNIKKGDELEISEQGSKLVISTGHDIGLESAKIVLTTADKFVKRPIHNLYRRGYDEVIVEFTDSTISSLILEQCETLLGFEIIDQSERKVILHNVASALDAEFETVFRRVFLMLTSMTRDIHDAVVNKEFDRLNEIASRERTNDKLAMFCQRLLNKRGYPDPKKLTMVYETVCQMEYIADDLRAICMLLLEVRKSSKEVELLLKLFVEIIENVHQLYFDYNIPALVKFTEKKQIVWNQAMFLLKERPVQERVIAHFVLEALNKMHHITENIS